jgi:hypothetical protein
LGANAWKFRNDWVAVLILVLISGAFYKRSDVGRKSVPTRPVLIVTGAHLSAEVHDRPLAYFLRDKVMAALGWSNNDAFTPGKDGGKDGWPAERVVVCSDLWYLNRDQLRELPTISVGGPTVNALTAYFGDKLPSAFAVDGVFVVQADWTETPVACCWGVDAGATARAVETFVEKYLEEWAGAV